MKRWLIVIAAVGALALILAGGVLFGHTRSASGAVTTVSLSSYPGNPDSGVTGSVSFMDVSTTAVGGTALGSWTAPPDYSNVAVFFYSGTDCDPLERVAVLVWHPAQIDQNIFLTNGVQFGAIDGSTILIDEATHAPYPGHAAGVLSVSMAAIPGYPAVDYAKVQYLACGNVGGAAVTGWDDLLDEDSMLIYPPVWLTAFEIDKVKDPGPDQQLGTADDTWCDPVENEADIDVNSTYQVAVCISNSLKPPASFNFDLVYDDSINLCAPDTDCTVGTCTDDNPDANADDSLATYTTWTDPDLGDGYNCGKGGSQPKCDIDGDSGVDQGRATISCFTEGEPTLPIGSGVSSPLAVVTFNATAEGQDILHLENVAAYNVDGGLIASCYEGEPSPCYDALDNKVPPPPATETPTPTATTPPTLTPTPTAVPAGVRMEKSPKLANLWLMAPSLGCVNAAEGKGCLEIEKWVYAACDADSPNDSDTVPEGVGAWEEQIKYDHKIVRLNPVPDNTWLESGGRVADCSMTILTENWILTGCITTGTGHGPGWDCEGSPGYENGLIETITVLPVTDDLIYRQGFRPAKDNGVVTDLVDENCEVTDTLAENLPGTLPGGLTTTCTDAHITVRILEGDLNLDCKVTVLDDQAIAFRYGTVFGMQLYDEWYDLAPECVDIGGGEIVCYPVPDFDIDIKDLQFVFGRNYSTCQLPIPDDQANPVPPPQPE